MGKNRKGNSDKQEAKVPKKLMDEFDIDMNDIDRFLVSYHKCKSKRLSCTDSLYESVCTLRDNRVVKYFAVIGILEFSKRLKV